MTMEPMSDDEIDSRISELEAREFEARQRLEEERDFWMDMFLFSLFM